jgi:pimeloyl-ACP methyl ester carboxylesterase
MGLLKLMLFALAILLLIAFIAMVRVLRRPPRRGYTFALARGWPVDPSQLDTLYIERELTLSDGGETTAWLIDGRKEDGPTIIFTHGWSDSRYVTLARWGAMLTDVGSRVVMYDLRAHGDSSADVCHGGTVEADDLVTIVEQLAGELPRPLVLFGHSMGAGITLGAAAQLCSRDPKYRHIDGVIVEGGYIDVYEPIKGIIRQWGWPAQPMVWLARTYERLFIKAFMHIDRLQDAKSLSLPLLIAHTHDDTLCPIEDARQLAAAAPDAKLIEFESGGHWQLAWTHGQAYADALNGFLSQLNSSAGRTEAATPPVVAAREDEADESR